MSEWAKFAGGGSSHVGEPFPFEQCRDVLGLARTLYAVRRDQGAARFELEKLALAGRRFAHALKLARSVGPNDLAVAWWQAEEGMKDLAAAIDPTMPVETILATARKRLTG